MGTYVRTQNIDHTVGERGSVSLSVTSGDLRARGIAGGDAHLRATFEISRVVGGRGRSDLRGGPAARAARRRRPHRRGPRQRPEVGRLGNRPPLRPRHVRALRRRRDPGCRCTAPDRRLIGDGGQRLQRRAALPDRLGRPDALRAGGLGAARDSLRRRDHPRRSAAGRPGAGGLRRRLDLRSAAALAEGQHRLRRRRARGRAGSRRRLPGRDGERRPGGRAAGQCDLRDPWHLDRRAAASSIIGSRGRSIGDG